jgi:uncharacterized damage-inducible protein DinB
MTAETPLSRSVLDAWRTSVRVTSELIDRLPPALWTSAVPGVPNRTVRMIAAHLHNARRNWIRTLGQEHGIVAPDRVDHLTVLRRSLLAALKASGRGIEAVLELGIRAGGTVPPSKGYTWRNLPLDVGHVLSYFVAHEAHHRGQIILIARQLGRRLPAEVTNGLWQWQVGRRKS